MLKLKRLMICLLVVLFTFSLQAQTQTKINEEIKTILDRLTAGVPTGPNPLDCSLIWLGKLKEAKVRLVEIYFDKREPIRSFVCFRGKLENMDIPSAREFFHEVFSGNPEDPKIILVLRFRLDKSAKGIIFGLSKERLYNKYYGGNGYMNISLAEELGLLEELGLRKVKLSAKDLLAFAQQLE